MTTEQPTIQRIEMKFQLDASLSAQVRLWARDHLGVDENCSADSGDSYQISTLYLDTPELDLFHRAGVIGAAKHRIRRYGDEQTLWLETKRKKKMVVRKNRTAVFESDWQGAIAECSAAGQPVESTCTPIDRPLWCGDWFVDRIVERRLQPAIQIAYRRFARAATLDGQSLRLTIDSHMTAGPIDGWNVTHRVPNNFSSIADHEILELKFHNQMPPLFKQLLRTFSIPATGFSKYRTGMSRRSGAANGSPAKTLDASALQPIDPEIDVHAQPLLGKEQWTHA